jgi:hypothetical protein
MARKLFKIFYNKFFLTWYIGAYLSFSVTPNVPVTYIALNISLPTSPGLVTISCNQCFSVNKWLSSGTKFGWWEKGMHNAALLTKLKFSSSRTQLDVLTERFPFSPGLKNPSCIFYSCYLIDIDLNCLFAITWLFAQVAGNRTTCTPFFSVFKCM